MVSKNCVICGTEFNALGKQKTCSKKCSDSLKKLTYRRIYQKWINKNPERVKEIFNRFVNKNDKYWKKYYRKQKIELVFALGGKCQKCGYNKCMQALGIHHVDPTVKEGNANSGRLYPRRVKKLIKLWKDGKIKLLCANCHMEEHASQNGA